MGYARKHRADHQEDKTHDKLFRFLCALKLFLS